MSRDKASISLEYFKVTTSSVFSQCGWNTFFGSRARCFFTTLVISSVVYLPYNYIVNSSWNKKKKNSLKRRHATFKKLNEMSLEYQDLIENDQRFSSIVIDGVFVNPFPEYKDISLLKLIFWKLFYMSLSYLHREDSELEKRFPIVKPDFKLLFDSNSPDLSQEGNLNNDAILRISDTEEKQNITEELNREERFTFTWLGQSTCFIQFGNLNILTDPMFSDKVIPVIGPTRKRPIPCHLSELKVDVVLISHNHPDNLDSSSVDTLGNSVIWYVPLGLRDWFSCRGIYRVVELDWWGSHIHQTEPKITITFTPTQHWSGRTLFDVDRSLWGGFVVQKEDGPNYFHCGETGYCQVFKEIGRRYGPIRLATIPIGSYHPRWLNQYHHVSPDEAIAIHKDIQAQTSFGVNWGTFNEADEHYLDPQLRLKEIRREHDFSTSKLGETRCIPFIPSIKMDLYNLTDDNDHIEESETPMYSSGVFISEQNSELDDGETGSEGFYTIADGPQ